MARTDFSEFNRIIVLLLGSVKARGLSQILGSRDKLGGIRGDTPRAPLCFPKFPSAALLAGQVWDAPDLSLYGEICQIPKI